jgi:hypothetical protein
MKIGKTASGIYFARYFGYVAIGNSAAQAYNNLVVLFQGAKTNGNNDKQKRNR